MITAQNNTFRLRFNQEPLDGSVPAHDNGITLELTIRLPLINYFPGLHSTAAGAAADDQTVVDDYFLMVPPAQVKATDHVQGTFDRVNLVEMITWSINQQLRG